MPRLKNEVLALAVSEYERLLAESNDDGKKKIDDRKVRRLICSCLFIFLKYALLKLAVNGTASLTSLENCIIRINQLIVLGLME